MVRRTLGFPVRLDVRPGRGWVRGPMDGAVTCLKCDKYDAMQGGEWCWLCVRKGIESPPADGRKYRYPVQSTPQLAIKIEECRLAGIPVNRLMSTDREKYIVVVRRRVARRMRDELGMSYPEIGRHLNRDHTSIIGLLKGPGNRSFVARHEDRDRSTGGDTSK